MGYSADWAKQYAYAKDQINYPHNVLETISECYKVSDEDLDLFAKLQRQGEMFEEVLKLAWHHEVYYRTEDLVYDFAINYVEQYDEMLAEGYSEIYAKAYLIFEQNEDSYITPELYAQMMDDAVKKGMSSENAEEFAIDASFIAVFDDDTIDSAPEYLRKYNEEWQQKYIIQCMAYILAGREHLYHEDDFVKLFIREIKNVDSLTNISQDEIIEILYHTLDNYYQQYIDEMPYDWEPYVDEELAEEDEPFE